MSRMNQPARRLITPHSKQRSKRMIYRSLFPGDLVAEMNRLQREMQQSFGMEPSIRGMGRGGFPALNAGSTPRSVELYAFVPGMDPASIDVHLERGVLTISGERPNTLAGSDEKANVHINERFAGRFRRVISLPEDMDPNGVTAQYRDGVLHVTIQRQQAVQPRRISVQ
jgi:HSP20 family protein